MRFKDRLASAAPLYVMALGLLCGFGDGLRVLFQSPHLSSGLLDGVLFLLYSATLYAVVGAALGIAAAIIPLTFVRGAANFKREDLSAFYLAALVCAGAAAVILVMRVSFADFTANLWSNLVTVLLVAGVSYLLVAPIAGFLAKSTALVHFLGKSTSHLRRWPVVAGLVVVLGAATFISLSPGSIKSDEHASYPNVLLISFDTLSAKHMQSQGYDKPTTPHIDEFAKEGARFDNHFTVSRITLPSHMTMFTSVYPSVHRVIDSFASVLDDRFLTLAEILQKHDYQTGAMVDGGPLLNIGAAHGFDHGFDFYEHFPERFVKQEKLILPQTILNFWENFMQRRGVPQMHSQTIFDGALNWLGKRDAEKPFFLFLHTYDIHSEFGTKLPYMAPDYCSSLIPDNYSGDFTGCGDDGECGTDYLVQINKEVRRGKPPEELLSREDSEYIATLYDRGIRYTDDRFGEFAAALARSGLLENTIVMLTSDHGEEFYQHDQMKHVQYYDEVLKAPLVIRYPEKISAGTEVEPLTRSVDLLPTILELADIDFESPQFQGVSLLPLAQGESLPDELALFAGQDHPTMDLETKIVRTLDYKYIDNKSDRMFYSFNRNRPEELYSMTEDPQETTNLVDSQPEVLAQMRERMKLLTQWCLEVRSEIIPDEYTEKRIKMDKKSAEALKSLGYIK